MPEELRIGLLGAAAIAPTALINPARRNPCVLDAIYRAAGLPLRGTS